MSTRDEIDELLATITGDTYADKMQRNSLLALRERFPEPPESTGTRDERR